MNILLIRHLVLKEVRYQRIRLILIWLVAYLLPPTNRFQSSSYWDDLIGVSRGGIFLLFVLLIVLTWVSAILLDPTYAPDRFLATRPVKWTTLLVSKILFVTLFLWLPLAIFRLGIVWTATVPLSFPDQLLYLFESTLIFIATASFFVLPALFFRRLTTIILFIVGCVVSVYVLSILAATLWNTLNLDSVFTIPTAPVDADPRVSLSLRVSGFLVACTILALTMVPVATLRYWKPALPIPLTVVFAGLFLSLTYVLYWPYQLDQFASDAPTPPGRLPSPLRDQIRINLQEISWDIARKWNDNTEYAEKNLEFHLVQKWHVEGIIRPLLIWKVINPIEIALPSGKKLLARYGATQWSFSSNLWEQDYMKQMCSGLAPTDPNYENSEWTQIYTFYGHGQRGHGSDISDLELPGATIRGNATIHVARLKILKVTPFKPGARLNFTRRCNEILQVVPDTRAIKILLNCSIVPIVLRGDLERAPAMQADPSFVVINRKTGEILGSNIDSDYYNPFDGLALQRWTFTRKLPPGAPKDALPPTFPHDWLNNADICFFEIDPLGSVDFPYAGTVTNISH